MTSIGVGTALLLAALSAPANLDPASVTVTEVADSGSYFVYVYTVSNPATSLWSVATVEFDVAASSGQPSALTATGPFRDLTVWAGATTPLSAYAPVGPINPSGWGATLTREAKLSFGVPSQGPVQLDSVPPGDSLAGFGIRSPYLPALTDVVALPTWQACCSIADSITWEAPSRRLFKATSTSIAPRYMPTEVTVDLLQVQLTAVCTDPLWITSGTLCAEFETLVDSAAAEFTGGDLQGAAMLLSDLFDRVETERQQMHSNAYWLLYLNIRQAYANIAAAGPGALGVVCNPASVERAASPVSCAPSAPIPPIGSEFFALTGWRFIGGPSNEFDISPPGAPAETWEGEMVVGGTVWLYGTLAGAADSASTTVTVTPRTWAAIPANAAVEEDENGLFGWGDMPTIPTAQDDLAHLHPRWFTDLTLAEYLARFVAVEEGPNESVAYFSGPLLHDFSPFYELTDALTDDQNAWYQNHPVGGNGTTCRQRDLPTIVFDFFDGEMVDVGTAANTYWAGLNFQDTHEALVSTDTTALHGAFDDALHDAFVALDSISNEETSAEPPCTLLY
jgi:hypothetical protein